MCSQESSPLDLPAIHLVRLNAIIQGITTGILAALGMFVATNWLVAKGGDVVGPNLGLLGHFFPGYRVTFLGSLIGAAYGFGLGFCAGFAVSILYNWLSRRKADAPGTK